MFYVIPTFMNLHVHVWDLIQQISEFLRERGIHRDLRLALICHKKKMKFKSKRFVLFGDIKIKQWVANILTNQNSPEKFSKF